MSDKHLTVGILAHVDAGKTTLSESILYTCGNIRKIGRVDHGDSFLDTNELERARGITIFSKQAEIQWKEQRFTLLDTPGHVDFSAEMERTLQVLDYAILVISGADGVQGHVKTLWKLLDRYEIPVFLFVNKMDQPGVDKEDILSQLQGQLSDRCIDFSDERNSEAFMENMAVCDDKLLEAYLNGHQIQQEDISKQIQKRNLFPCFFGSALKMLGVEEFLDGLIQYTMMPEYPGEFGAKVYKISRDKQGMRLTHMKITGGSLRVKTQVQDEDKVDQIRIYSGNGYTMVPEVRAGQICTVTGLNNTKAGMGLGIETDSQLPMLEPVLTYKIVLPEEYTDIQGIFLKLKQLEEEEPELHIVWEEQLEEIHARVMGEIQIEILKSMMQDRFGIALDFDAGSIVYKETIVDSVEGLGHYEPLRHYAEVRLLLEPTKPGSGLTFATEVSEDRLHRNWQRLILTHLAEKKHKGVLTGSEITDMRITVINGRAHLKHTEGGDFREATYRAVRQGLRRAESILLEPFYEYELEVPVNMVGRAMADMQQMQGTFSAPDTVGDIAVLKGSAPVSRMRNYQREVVAYTKGEGRLTCVFKGYEPCMDADKVIEEIGYDAEADLENPTGSVFCSHGAGFVVPWNEVEDYMHTESLSKKNGPKQSVVSAVPPQIIDEEELKAIFEKTYGANKRESAHYAKTVYAPSCESKKHHAKEVLPEVLLVDGYNIIFAWEELKDLADVNLEGARGKLTDILCNYQGYRKNHVVLVFDGYKVPGNLGEVIKHHNIYIVYTKEAETADQYIEKTVADMSKKYDVRVATSDAMEQLIILGQGARRVSANEFLEEIKILNQEIREEHLERTKKTKQYLFEGLADDLAEFVDDVRMGRRQFQHEEAEKDVE